MSKNYSIANYNGKVPNSSASIKEFTTGKSQINGNTNLWTTSTTETNTNILVPASPFYSSLLVPGDLYLNGNFINASDFNLKTNITNIDNDTTEKIMRLVPYSYSFKKDETNKIHFGFIAQEVEEEIPELINRLPVKDDSEKDTLNFDESYKGINYLEIIPLLVDKVQKQQKQINELQSKLNVLLKKM